jgi:undecaprenyl-diphosphatase
LSPGIEVFKAVVIGVVQALTEFLPVSSSGHMVITKSLLNIEEVGITIEVMTHFATALAVFVYLRRRIVEILTAVLGRIGARSMTDAQAKDFRLFLLVILGSVPAAAVGLAIREQVGGLFQDVTATSVMLMVTGVFVFVSGRLARQRASLGIRQALVIGVAQAFAIVPGISRSGLTVGSGLMAGVDRREAFEFSLLLSLPAILGAALIESLTGRIGGDPVIIVAAAVPAFVGGYVAISLLFRAIVRNKFHAFAYYLIPLGIALLLFM